MIFSINGTMWQVQYKNSNSGELKRSDNVSVLGVTDRNTHTIYLSNALRGFMQRKVLIHEVCHAICMSYDVYLPIEQKYCVILQQLMAMKYLILLIWFQGQLGEWDNEY